MLEELIALAKEMDAAARPDRRHIAAELITQVRKSVSVDWTLRESARTRIRVMVKRILNKYAYQPDLQEEAVQTVRQQAELFCAEWA